MNRSITTDRTTFTLPFPHAATFDFAPASPAPSPADAIRITIPPASTWRMPYHWHPSADHTAPCERVTCLSGSLSVYIASGTRRSMHRIGSTGLSVTFAPGERVSWNRLDKGDNTALSVDLWADHTLWRNVCGAVLDKDIFPRLAATPWWLKGLFAVLAVAPSWRAKLLHLMLWVQLRTVFHAHDFHVYSGYVPVTRPWAMQPFGGRAPDWASRLQIQSLYAAARVVTAVAYWVGTLFLGMKPSYVEYTPGGERRDEKR